MGDNCRMALNWLRRGFAVRGMCFGRGKGRWTEVPLKAGDLESQPTDERVRVASIHHLGGGFVWAVRLGMAGWVARQFAVPMLVMCVLFCTGNVGLSALSDGAKAFGAESGGVGGEEGRAFGARAVATPGSFSQAEWFGLGGEVPGVSGPVYAVAVSGKDVYVGGTFRMAGGTSADLIAKWDGVRWSALSSGMDRAVYALAMVGTNLYAGGNFSTAGGVPASYIARWDGSAWHAVGGGMDETVYALAVAGDTLYASGGFKRAGGVTVNHIARWDGVGWSALGAGTDSTAYSLVASGNVLYAGGGFSTAGSVAASCVAKWDGQAWSALGSGVDNFVFALAVLGNDVIAGGDFSTAGGLSARAIARWDGNGWSAMGTVVNTTLFALAVSGDALYTSAFNPVAGGDAHIGRWSGNQWSTLRLSRAGSVTALAVSEGSLYVGGTFAMAGNKVVNNVARVSVNVVGPGELPKLQAGRSGVQIVISWPSAGSAGYILEEAAGLQSAGSWTRSNLEVKEDSGTKSATIVPTTQRFFRLRRL